MDNYNLKLISLPYLHKQTDAPEIFVDAALEKSSRVVEDSFNGHSSFPKLMSIYL